MLLQGALKYINHMPTDMKEEIDNNIILVEDFSILFSTVDSTFRKKISIGQRTQTTP